MRTWTSRSFHSALLLALSIGGSVLADVPTDEESRRVDLVARLERSVVVVLVKGREITKDQRVVEFSPTESLGTGVVLTGDGLILTAAHVVESAERIEVIVSDDQSSSATVVFADEGADIALLRLAEVARPLVPARLGDSDRTERGETVYVIGNPFGMEKSLSVGVISGRHRLQHVFGGVLDGELLQTDAAINTGASGGPMFNSRGEVIAVAQRILSKGGGSEGVGFGLAINVVKTILALDPCMWLGVSGVPLDQKWSAALNVPEAGGVLVQRVAPDSAAARAGIVGGTLAIHAGEETILLGGDVILRIDDEPIRQWAQKPSPPNTPPGTKHELKVTLLRNGERIVVPVVNYHRSSW